MKYVLITSLCLKGKKKIVTLSHCLGEEGKVQMKWTEVREKALWI